MRFRMTFTLKSKLFALIAFLGLLPAAGAGVTYLALGSNRVVQQEQDAADKGTVSLERINGLVYAVVMESRGIYMSKDWDAASPFAANLMKALGDMQNAVAAWKAHVVEAERAKIATLSDRIDEFVRFRGELVRLAKDESTAAARAYGDNDANRQNRSALNNELKALAANYQRHTQVANDHMQVITNRNVVLVSGARRVRDDRPVRRPVSGEARSDRSAQPSQGRDGETGARGSRERHPRGRPGRRDRRDVPRGRCIPRQRNRAPAAGGGLAQDA